MTNFRGYWDELTQLTQLGLFPPTSGTETNKAIARRMLDGIWNQDDLDVADEIFAPISLDMIPAIPILAAPLAPMATNSLSQCTALPSPTLTGQLMT